MPGLPVLRKPERDRGPDLGGDGVPPAGGQGLELGDGRLLRTIFVPLGPIATTVHR